MHAEIANILRDLAEPEMVTQVVTQAPVAQAPIATPPAAPEAFVPPAPVISDVDAELQALFADIEPVEIETIPTEDLPSPHNPPRSKYLGVYHNNGNNSNLFMYRAAICLFKGQPNQKWINLGYFNCEHVAATAYNVASINYFNGKGMLNPVNKPDRDVEEYTLFLARRKTHILSAQKMVQSNAASGIKPRMWEIRAA